MVDSKESAASADARAASAAASAKPVKPDPDAFNAQLGKLEKEHQNVMARYNAVKAKIDLTTPNKNKDALSPTEKRRQELLAQVNEIRKQQAGAKNGRTSKMEQVKRLDDQVRSRLAEQKAARSKLAFKSAEDVDREIARLEAQVNGGQMKLVDEKKALAEVSSLRKQRKTFAHFHEQQKQIDDLRAKIKEIKDTMDDAEARATGEQYNKLQAELEAIKAEQDEAYKGLSKLREERSKVHAEQNETFAAIRKLKDDYYAQRKAFSEWEREQRQKTRERHQAERDRITKERRLERAQEMLAEASDPAYWEEIRRANSLLRFFDPTHTDATKSPLRADKGLSAQAQRKVDDAGIQGMKLLRKEDREEEYLPAVKKGKKGKKSGNAAAAVTAVTAADGTAPAKFNCPPSVMEDCAFLGLDPPMSSSQLPAVLEKIREKLEQWKKDQPEQTRKNIEKAQKEIERLEAEEAGEGPGTNGSHDTNSGNEKKSEEKHQGVADITDVVQATSLQDRSGTPVEATT